MARRVAGAVMVLAPALLVLGACRPVTGACSSDLDCTLGGFCDEGACTIECYSDDDCQNPDACALGGACDRALRCSPHGRCVGSAGRPGGFVEHRGFDDPPASGRAFAIESLRIADRSGVGFDVDGKCRGPGECIDNSLASVGQIANDQIRQGLLGGETLLVIELAGIEEGYAGDERFLTVKVYGARDADEPAFPANNFQIPSGETTCCAFQLEPDSLVGTPPQARWRALARVERGQLITLAAATIHLPVSLGSPPFGALRLERAWFSARLPTNLRELKDGLLGGAVSIRTFAETDNPYCKTVSDPLCPALIADSRLIDLVVALQQPDVDLDGDGLERLERDVLGDGRVHVCRDGSGEIVPPLVPGAAWTCTLDPRMADGFSMAVELAAVAATITGVSVPE